MKILVTTIYTEVSEDFARWASERWFTTKEEASDFLNGEVISLVSKDATSSTIAKTEWKIVK